MPQKNGMGGHGPEAYDPTTGKFIEDGQPNVRHDNPQEANKIQNHIPAEKIQEQSANKQTNPIPNLGKYGKPRSEKDQILKNEFGIKKEEEDDWDDLFTSGPKSDAHRVLRNNGLEDIFYDDPRAIGKVYADIIDYSSLDVEPNTLKEIKQTGKLPLSVINKLEKIYSSDELEKVYADFVEENVDYFRDLASEIDMQPELVDVGPGKVGYKY
jgi:hypothetical protein